MLVLKAMPADPAHPPSAEEAVHVGRATSGSVLDGGTLRLYSLRNVATCDEAFVPATVDLPGVTLNEATMR